MGTVGNGRPPVEGGGGNNGDGGERGGSSGGGSYWTKARKVQFENATKAIVGQGHEQLERDRIEAFERLTQYETKNQDADRHVRDDIIDLRLTNQTASGVVFLQVERFAHILERREGGDAVMNRLGINGPERELKLALNLFDIVNAGVVSSSQSNLFSISTERGPVAVVLSRRNNGYAVTMFNTDEGYIS